MAQNEVVIRLTGTSQQLQAQLTRIQTQLTNIAATSHATQTTIQTGAQKSAKSIDNQNKSFTLMIAKLALVTFAVQTLANIFQNTFGAVLNKIDEFNLAAIGTASAITGITSELDRPVADVFNQNLEATKVLFEKLEIVAADFFASGAELQLAFNTLAQRGVVVREDEFRILAKITDQIKLLTGGQNTEIQIQQELRAILDGNVRTTTAFGKALQARGVDVAQLAREVQATGSLAAFEPFLTGLDAASGAIKRTLTSVLSTFQSLFNILSRGIFEDTFDSVVAKITEINNLLIDNRQEIIAVGKLLVEKVVFGANLVLGVFKQISDVIGDIVSDDLLRMLAILKVITAASSGPIRAFLIIGVAIAALSGDINNVDKAFKILIGTLRITLKLFSDIVTNGVNGLRQLADKFNFNSANSQLKDLKIQLAGIDNVLSRAGTSAEERQKLLVERAQVLEDITNKEQELFEAAAQSVKRNIDLRITDLELLESTGRATKENLDELKKLRDTAATIPFDTSISDGLTEIQKKVDAVVQSLGLTPATQKLKDTFDSLLKEAGALGSGAGDSNISPTKIQTVSDDTLARQQLEGLNKRIDAARKAQIDSDDQLTDAALANIDLLAAQRKITALQAFNQQRELSDATFARQKATLLEEEAIVKQRTESERLAIEARAASDNGPTHISETQKILDLDKLRTEEALKLQEISNKTRDLQAKQDAESVRAAIAVAKSTIVVNRLIQDRNQGLIETGGKTNADIAARINLEAQRARSDFEAQNLRSQGSGGRTQLQKLANDKLIADFEQQQRQINLFKAIKPQLDAFTTAVEQAFDSLINGIIEGSFKFRDLAKTVSQDLIKSGLQNLIEGAKDAVTKGLTKLFDGFSAVAAQQAAQALALGLGLLLAVLSKAGNKGDFTATGGSGAGSSISSAAQTRGLIGGQSSIPIAEINTGLQEAMIPTNNLLAQIERNTRSLGALGTGGNLNVQDLFNDQLQQFFNQQILNP